MNAQESQTCSRYPAAVVRWSFLECWNCLRGTTLITGWCGNRFDLSSSTLRCSITNHEDGHDVIVLVAECGFLQCDANVTSLNDSSGLAFNQRTVFAPNDRLWEFFARAKAPLSSDNITIVLSSDFPSIVVFAVREANAKAVFDNDPSLPGTVACPSAGLPGACSASAQTSTPDFVIAIVAINDAPACGEHIGGPPGFTHIDSAGGLIEVDYQIVAAPTNVLFSCTGTEPVAVVIDAISSHA